MRPMFGAFGKAGSAHSIAFVGKAWNTSLSRTHSYTCTVYVGVYFSFLINHCALSQAGSVRQWSKNLIWTEQEGGSCGQREEAHQTRYEAQ